MRARLDTSSRRDERENVWRNIEEAENERPANGLRTLAFMLLASAIPSGLAYAGDRHDDSRVGLRRRAARNSRAVGRDGRARLQRVDARSTPRHATTHAPGAPEFEPRNEVAVNHAEMIDVQRFTLMAMLPNRMFNVAEDAVTGPTEQAPGPAAQCGAMNGAGKPLSAVRFFPRPLSASWRRAWASGLSCCLNDSLRRYRRGRVAAGPRAEAVLAVRRDRRATTEVEGRAAKRTYAGAIDPKRKVRTGSRMIGRRRHRS